MLHLTTEPNESLKLQTPFSRKGEMRLINFCQNVLHLQSLINQNISKDFLIVKFRFANSASFIRVQV